MRGLYAIVDTETLERRKLDPIRFSEAVLACRPAALQLRAKNTAAREVLSLLRSIVPLCHRAGVPLVANDRVDLAAFASCDMIHLGQDDIAIELARRLAPGIRAGLSTHSLEQLRVALETKPAYVAFGPVYPTTTKQDPAPVVGVDALKQAAELARAMAVPIVAIGGIDHARAAEIARYVDSIAVIGAILPLVGSGDPWGETAKAAASLHALFQNSQ